MQSGNKMYHKRLQALTCFFVFNPTLAPKERDDETLKILYYFPSRNVPAHTQCAFVGLVSGIVNFSKDFSSQPAHSLHTERNRYVFDEVEPNMWITLVLKNPRKDYQNTSSKKGGHTGAANEPPSKNASNNASADANDDGNHGDSKRLASIHSEYYMEEELEDSVLHTIIKTAYSTFVFFHGTFDHIVSNAGMDKLRQSLKLFFRYYLPTVQFHQLRYYADIYGFRFLAVDRTTYLTLQYLSNIVMSEFPALHSLCVMYNGKLIWSGLEQRDMRVLYTNNQTPNDSYMYTFMAKVSQKRLGKNESLRSPRGQSSAAGTEYQFVSVNNQSHSSSGRRHHDNSIVNSRMNHEGASMGAANLNNLYRGEFLSGPLSKDFFSQQTPMIYLCGKNRFYRLICYRFEKLKLFWLMDDASLEQPLNSTTDDLFDDMIRSLDLEEDNIAEQISEIVNEEDNHEMAVHSNHNNGHHNGDATAPTTVDLGPLGHASMHNNHNNTNTTNHQQSSHHSGSPHPRGQQPGHGRGHENPRALQKQIQFYEELQKFIEPHAEDIYIELNKHEQRLNKKQNNKHGGQSGFRFLYFNHENLALKSILKAPGKKLAAETCRTLRNIHSDFEDCSSRTMSEICVKCSDGWVVARKSHFAGRELYLLVDTADASQLKELQDHFEALEDEFFSNIFLL